MTGPKDLMDDVPIEEDKASNDLSEAAETETSVTSQRDQASISTGGLDEPSEDLSIQSSFENDEEHDKNQPIPRRSTQKRNAGRSKISTGTKKYVTGYQEQSSDGILRLGNLVPDFAADSTKGKIESFHEWKKGKWAVLFSHPSDFTPVCTTEIAGIATIYPKLKERNCLLIGLSVGSAETHEAWMQDIVAHYQEQYDNQELDVDFPLIADHDRNVASLFGMLDASMEEYVTIRSLFIIDPDHRLRLSLSYPASVGRNVDEVMRCVNALQLSYEKSIATPANWPNNHPQIKLDDGTISEKYQGSVFLLPTVSTEQAFLNYPDYHTCSVPSEKNYLRLVQANHVGVDVSAIMLRSNKDSKYQDVTNNTTNNPVAQRKEQGTQTMEERWRWPWESDDTINEDEAARKEEPIATAKSEPFKWPWESHESGSQDNAPEGQAISESEVKPVENATAAKVEPFKWPWESEEPVSKENNSQGQSASDGDATVEDNTEKATAEPFRWPWESDKTTSINNNNLKDDTITNGNDNNSKKEESVATTEKPFRWPWQRNDGE